MAAVGGGGRSAAAASVAAELPTVPALSVSASVPRGRGGSWRLCEAGGQSAAGSSLQSSCGALLVLVLALYPGFGMEARGV